MMRRLLWVSSLAILLFGTFMRVDGYAQEAHHPAVGSPDHWYPISCCSRSDCIPIPSEAVRVSPEGWIIVKTGELIRWKDPRKKDTPPEGGGMYHWCRHLTGPNKDQTICLYVPPGGA